MAEFLAEPGDSVGVSPLCTTAAVHAGPSPTPYRGSLQAADFGSPENEFQAAFASAVLLDSNWKVRVRVAGGDAQRWLNGMLTNTAEIPVGHGNYSFLLNPQGRIQGDAYLFHLDDGFVLETSRDQLDKLLAWLEHYIIMDDVELREEQESGATFTIAGPQAAALAGLDAMEPLAVRDAMFDGIAARVVREDMGQVPAYHVWHLPAVSADLWKLFLTRGLQPAGSTTAELLRIAAGTPLVGTDILERDLAPETGQQRALHFAKGCYIGQEIVERVRSRGAVHRGLRGFVIAAEDPLPPRGAEVVADEKPIGKLTSVATLPFAGKPMRVGMGIVRTQPLDEGATLKASGVGLKSVALPFTSE